LAEEPVDRTAYVGRPSVCRHCGALVGADEMFCMQCGAPVRFAPARESETRRFIYAIFSRPAPFTIIFLTVNIFFSVLMALSGGSENYSVLVAYGAKLNALIDRGEWWRFVTPIFLHAGPIHLFFNMYGLWVLGPYVERLYGSAKFVVFWIVSGIVGVAASYLTVRPELATGRLTSFLFRAQDAPSVGASGALFGLIGVLFVFGIKYRRELPEGFKRAFGTGMLPIIIVNLIIGYAGRGFIDNGAHIGGLLSGIALALIVDYKRPGESANFALFWRALQVSLLLLVVSSFYMIATHFSAPPPTIENAVNKIKMGKGGVEAYVEAINRGEQAFLIAFTKGDAQAAEDGLRALDYAPYLDDQADQLRYELKALLMRARALAEAARSQARSPALGTERENLLLAFESWRERFKLWVELDGHRYGITLEPAPNGRERS
jgi:rhomboid protease GluP